MASFNNEPNKSSDPSYLGLSQGTDRMKANTSMGELFSNIATLGGQTVKAVKGIQEQALYKDIEDRVNKIRSDAGVDTAAELAAAGVSPTSVKGETNVVGDANIRAGQGNPAGVSRFGQRLAGLNAKYHEGEMSEAYYNSRMLAMVKEVKSQHSGWNQEIDSITKSITGMDPANSLVKSLRADMDASERARTAGMSKLETQIHTDIPYVTEATRQKILSGDRSPEVVQQFQVEAAGFRARNAELEQSNKVLEQQTKLGKVSEDRVLNVATASADHYVNEAFINGNSMVSASGILQKIKENADKPWSPEESETIRGQFRQFAAQVELGVHNHLAQEHFSSLPEDKKKGILERVKSRVSVLEKAIIDKDTGTLGIMSRSIEAKDNVALSKALENDTIRLLRTISEAGKGSGPQLIAGFLSKGEGLNKFVAAVNDLHNMKLATGEAKSLNELHDAQIKLSKDTGTPELKDPASFKLKVDNTVRGLVNAPDVQSAENFAKVMFGKENIGYLGKYYPESQSKIYRAMTSPAVDQKMVELGKSNPEVYQSYRDWVVNYGFQSQVKRALSSTVEEFKNPNSPAEIRFNPNSNQFEVGPKAGQEGYIREQKARGNDVLRGANSAVADVNEQIRIISPILKREGGDVTKQVGDILSANGWDPNAPKNPTFVQSLGNAISGFFKKEEPYGAEKAKPFEYRPDNSPKDRSFRSDATPEGDLIDLNPASLGNISSKAAELKKVIVGAEASGNYDAVFGTSRKIPVTKMTLDEVDALQGQMKQAGSESTAVGGFQFLQKTLRDLREKLDLKGNEVFDQKLQNRLADALLQRRGFGEYLDGKIGHKELVNRLSQEWAGLPTTKGVSHYEGVGSNKATVKLRDVLGALKVKEEG